MAVYFYFSTIHNHKSVPVNKVVILISFVALACKSNVAQETKPNQKYQYNWKTNNLKGKVKSITEFNYQQYVPDSELTYYVTKEYFTFSPTGNVMEHTTFLEHQSFQSKHVYKYDNAGNYTEFTAYAEDGTFKYKEVYEFDKMGHMVANEEHNSRGITRSEYFYNSNDDRILIMDVLPVRGSKTAYQYTYDSIGRRLSQEYSYQPSNPSKVLWEYRGDTVQELHLERGKFDYKELIIYNKDHKMLWRKLTGDRSTPDFEESYKFDPSGNEIEYVMRKPEIISRESYRREYVYDKQGNWIKRTTYKLDGSLKQSIERKIVYY